MKQGDVIAVGINTDDVLRRYNASEEEDTEEGQEDLDLESVPILKFARLG